MTTVVRWGTLALVLLSAAGCGRDSVGLTGRGASSDLRIRPSSLELFRGQTFNVDVVQRQPDGTEVSVLGDPDLVLVSFNPSVVTIDTRGEGLAVARGDTTINARFDGSAAEARINVTNADLTGIRVVPDAVQIGAGESVALQVFGVLTDGGEIDLTSAALGTTYTVQVGQGLVAVSDDGRIEAFAPGSAAIEVSNSGFNAVVPVLVSDEPDRFVDLIVEPGRLVLEFGETAQVIVLGIRADGTVEDVTGQATFSDAFPIAFVGPGGVVEAGMEPGSTLVEVRFQDLSTVFEVTLTPPMSDLISLRVEPPELQLAVGESAQLRVIGEFADGSTADLTNASAGTGYRVEGPDSVFVDGNGEVTAVVASPIPAIVVVTNSGFEVPVPVFIINDAIPVSLEVTPNPITVDINETVDLRVTALFSDGSSRDVSGSPLLNVGAVPPNLAIVNQNRLTGRAVGTGQVFIEYLGVATVVPFEVGDSDPVVSLRIFPTPIEFDATDVFTVSIFATRQSGAEVDVTNDPALFATVDNGAVARYVGGGRLLGVSAGQTVLIASYLGVTEQVVVRVTESTPQIIGISLNVATRVGVNQTTPITVLAELSDGSVQDVTNDPNIALSTGSPTLRIEGRLLRGVSLGMGTVTASFSGFTDTATVLVIDTMDPFVRIVFAPAGSITVAVGGAETVNVIGVRASGASEVVTFESGLLLSPTGNSFTTSIGMSGIEVRGATAGSGTLTATLNGLQATLQITVSGTVTLQSIALTGATRLSIGGTSILEVIATFSDGSTQDVTNAAGTTITSLNTAAVTVTGDRATGVAVGTSVIRAEFQMQVATLTIEVLNNANTVSSLDFIPPNLVLTAGGVGDIVRLQATFLTGIIADVTFSPDVTYAQTGPITVTNDPTGLLVRGNRAGSASIQATLQGVSTTLNVFVLSSSASLSRITLTAPSSLQVGTNAPYTVNAVFSDGTVVDVTRDPALFMTTRPTGIATAINGTLSGVAAGTTTVQASFGGQTAQTQVTVVAVMDPIRLISFVPPTLSLSVGQQRTVRLVGVRQSGATVELAADPNVALTTTGPVQLGMTPITVIGTSPGGLGQVNATFQGLTAALPVTVGNAPTLDDLIVSPPGPVTLSIGDTQALTVTGRFSDGSIQPIVGATFVSPAPTVADVSSSGVITAIGAGTVPIAVTFGGLLRLVFVTVNPAGPTITQLSPDAIAVGAPTTAVTVTGANFANGAQVLINNVPQPTRFLDATTLQVSVPSTLLTAAGQLSVTVRVGTQTSNAVSIEVGEAPVVLQAVPSAVVVGGTITAELTGSGLNNITFGGSDLTITLISSTGDGSSARIRVNASPSARLGPRTVTVTNAFGSDTFIIEVFPSTDLIVNAGQTVTLSGTNQYRAVVVNTGGTIRGIGNEPLTIIAASSMAIRGSIDVSGADGGDGLADAGNGGDAGPGGAGGGGGGDGLGTAGAGGTGSPNGANGVAGGGAGTPGGFGGGVGGGGPGATGCGQAGGGGALGGNGGDGGGDPPLNTGGRGGLAGSGSTFGGGTGGGGGSTCGNNGGGGGGGGGGRLILQLNGSGTILIDGQINAAGGAGGDGFSGTGGGGGGSGGRIEIRTNGGTILVNDTITARGGGGGNTDFGDSGGGGGGGIVVLDARPGGTINVALGQVIVDGGVAGIPRGGATSGQPGDAGRLTTFP